MMTLYVSPYRRMARVRNAMNRLLEENVAVQARGEREMSLALDVQAEDETYVICALVPGLKAEEINVEVLNDTVTIRGEFKDHSEAEPRFLLNELPTGRFYRLITLPAELDASKAEASLKDGVFTLRVPKAESHRPKVIKINPN